MRGAVPSQEAKRKTLLPSGADCRSSAIFRAWHLGSPSLRNPKSYLVVSDNGGEGGGTLFGVSL